MYKCDECYFSFDKPINIAEDTGEEFNVCPRCKTTSYDEVYECYLCEKHKHGNEIQDHICYKCAKTSYTNRIGLLFLDRHKEFYLWYFGINKCDNDRKEELIEILQQHYLDNIDLENDWNKYLEELRYYILSDENLYDYIKFLGDLWNVG